MKKFLTMPVAVLCLFTACQKKDANRQPTADETPTEEVTQRCASQEILEEQMKANPDFRRARQELEANTARILQNKSAYKLLADGTVEIPVVVYVLYRTTKENISDDQIDSQFEVLNDDYQLLNTDKNKVPSPAEAEDAALHRLSRTASAQVGTMPPAAQEAPVQRRGRPAPPVRNTRAEAPLARFADDE